jgi:excisionase family DNA binding protein
MGRYDFYLPKGRGKNMQAHSTQTLDNPDKRTYQVEEIAGLLGIGRSSAYELVKQGLFRTVKIGTAIRISKKSFDDWLDSQGN